MNSIANRLKELRDYKIRSQYVKDRLYAMRKPRGMD